MWESPTNMLVRTEHGIKYSVLSLCIKKKIHKIPRNNKKKHSLTESPHLRGRDFPHLSPSSHTHAHTPTVHMGHTMKFTNYTKKCP